MSEKPDFPLEAWELPAGSSIPLVAPADVLFKEGNRIIAMRAVRLARERWLVFVRENQMNKVVVRRQKYTTGFYFDLRYEPMIWRTRPTPLKLRQIWRRVVKLPPGWNFEHAQQLVFLRDETNRAVIVEAKFTGGNWLDSELKNVGGFHLANFDSRRDFVEEGSQASLIKWLNRELENPHSYIQESWRVSQMSDAEKREFYSELRQQQREFLRLNYRIKSALRWLSHRILRRESQI